MVGGVRVPVGQAPSSRGSALREVGSSSLLARRSPVVPKAGAGWRPAAPEAGVRGCDRRTGRPGPLCVEKAPVWAAVGGIRLPRICCCARGEGPPPTLESLQCALASSNSTTRPTPTLPSPPPHQPVPGPLARSVAISARTGRFSPGWLAVPCRGTLAGKGPAVKRGRAAGGGGGWAARAGGSERPTGPGPSRPGRRPSCWSWPAVGQDVGRRSGRPLLRLCARSGWRGGRGGRRRACRANKRRRRRPSASLASRARSPLRPFRPFPRDPPAGRSRPVWHGVAAPSPTPALLRSSRRHLLSWAGAGD